MNFLRFDDEPLRTGHIFTYISDRILVSSFDNLKFVKVRVHTKILNSNSIDLVYFESLAE